MRIWTYLGNCFIHALKYFRRPINFPNAILRTTKRELVTFCGQFFALYLKLIKISHDQKNCFGGGGGGGGSTP